MINSRAYITRNRITGRWKLNVDSINKSAHAQIDRFWIGLPCWFSWYRIHLQCRRRGFNPLIRKALQKEMVTHSGILAWGIPRTEEPGGLKSMGSQRAGHGWVTEHADRIHLWTSFKDTESPSKVYHYHRVKTVEMKTQNTSPSPVIFHSRLKKMGWKSCYLVIQKWNSGVSGNKAQVMAFIKDQTHSAFLWLPNYGWKDQGKQQRNNLHCHYQIT